VTESRYNARHSQSLSLHSVNADHALQLGEKIVYANGTAQCHDGKVEITI